jgi:dUTP pyrophosphatase
VTAIDRLHGTRRRLRWSRIDKDGPGLHAPKRAGDIGWDLEAAQDYNILPGQQVDVATNIRLELPEDVWAEVRARSSIAKRHLQVEAGTIDPGYRGPIYALLRNIRPEDRGALSSIEGERVVKGERVAQIVFHKVCAVWAEEVDEVNINTERGEGGFGSTGR